jgi:hypothetical protein
MGWYSALVSQPMANLMIAMMPAMVTSQRNRPCNVNIKSIVEFPFSLDALPYLAAPRNSTDWGWSSSPK